MDPTTIIRSLAAAAKVLWKTLRPLAAEKAAGHAPENVRSVDASLFEDAIGRLVGGKPGNSLISQLANKLAHKLITPEHLDTQNVVDWLNDPSVIADLKRATDSKVLGAVIPKDVSTRLEDKYGRIALANAQESRSAVSAVVSMLAEAVNSRVDDKGTGAIVVSSHHALSAQIQLLQDRTDNPPSLTQQKAEEIISLSLEANEAWLSRAFGDRRTARSAFGQALSPGDETVSRTVERRDLRDALTQNAYGTPDGSVTALLGADGNGKSWIFAQAWLHQSKRPLTVVVVPDDINGHPSREYCLDLLISKILIQTEQTPSHKSKDLWHEIWEQWQSPTLTAPRLIVFLDGINQRASVSWIRFIDQMSEVLAQVGGKLVLSCRRGFYRDFLENKLLSNVVQIDVPEWTDSELNDLLSERGTSIAALDPQVVKSLRNPRIFGVAAALFSSEEISAFGELSISRLLFEHIRSGSAAEGTKKSDSQFKADIREHARRIVERLSHQRQNEDFNEFDMPTLFRAEGADHTISENVITSAGRFFEVLEEDPNKYFLKDEGLPLALGLALVTTAREALRKHKSVDDALYDILEPIAALDRTSEILMGAILAAVLEDSPVEIVSPLVRCFVILQNIDSLYYPEFRSFFARNPSAFLTALENSSLSRDAVSNLSWLTSAADDLRGDESFEAALSTSVHRWLSMYSLAAERKVYYPNTRDYDAEREKKRAEREQELSEIVLALSHTERDLLDGMTRVDHGDYSALSLLAFHALARRPLAPYAVSLRNWCFSNSLNGGHNSYREVFDDLLHFNVCDWAATKNALRESAKPLRDVDVSAIGQWALVRTLRVSGNSKEALEAETIIEQLTKDTESFPGWRLIENYCASDPCDPNSEKPDNIETTAVDYKTIDPAQLSLGRGNSNENHFFAQARPGLARFCPDAAMEVMQALADEAVTRPQDDFRLAVYLLESHSLALDDAIATPYVAKASDIAQAALEAGEDVMNEAWVMAQHALLIAFAHMTGEEQLAALQSHPADKTILREVCHLFLPVETATLEQAFDRAMLDENQVTQFRLLCFAEHSGSTLSTRTKTIIITLLNSGHRHVRLSAMSLIQSTEDPLLLETMVNSEWSVTTIDRKAAAIEIFYGSLALVKAAEQHLISIHSCLERIGLCAYESFVQRLGPDAARAISDSLNEAILKVARFQVSQNLPHIEQNIGGRHWPEVIEVSQKVLQQEDFSDRLKHLADTSEAWYLRQKQNQDAFDRFEQELVLAGADLMIQPITIGLISAIDKVAPALVDSWCTHFLTLDGGSFNNVHNIAALVAETVAQRNVPAAVALFERLKSGSPEIHVTLGRVKTELEAVCIWRSAHSGEIQTMCFTRLDSIDNDYELSMEILAALQAKRDDLLRAYVVDRRQREEPAHRARATMVAGLCADEDWAIETIDLLKDEHGFLRQAYNSAKYAMDRHQWSRHWASHMQAASDPRELWRYTVLLSKIVDGRFYSMDPYGQVPSPLVKRFGVSFDRPIRNRIHRWKSKRETKLFGASAPSKAFITDEREGVPTT